MKRFAIVALVLTGALLVPSIAFAQTSSQKQGTQPSAAPGSQQWPQAPDGPRGPRGPGGPMFDQQLLQGGVAQTANGTVSVKGRVTTIAVGGKTYQLVSPGRVFEDIKLVDGTSVSLEGQLYTNVNDPWVKSDGIIFVRTITFGGQNYDLVALAEAKRAQHQTDDQGRQGPQGQGPKH